MKQRKSKRHRKLIFRFINAYNILAPLTQHFVSVSVHKEKEKKAFYCHASVMKEMKVKFYLCD